MPTAAAAAAAAAAAFCLPLQPPLLAPQGNKYPLIKESGVWVSPVLTPGASLPSQISPLG